MRQVRLPDGAAPLAERHKRSTKEKKKSADGATLSADEWRSRGALIARVATERAEGDATVHSSSLLHGVARVHGAAVRYSLILFFARAG